MEAKDLMLGNWIRDDKYCQIVEVSDIYLYAHTLKTCSPIPITSEILRNIGFEEHEGICPKTFYRYWDKEYRYKLDVDPDFCNSDRKFSIHIDNGDCETIGCGEFTYVHELQNLVRINCKADLPITKEMIYGLESR